LTRAKNLHSCPSDLWAYVSTSNASLDSSQKPPLLALFSSLLILFVFVLLFSGSFDGAVVRQVVVFRPILPVEGRTPCLFFVSYLPPGRRRGPLLLVSVLTSLAGCLQYFPKVGSNFPQTLSLLSFLTAVGLAVSRSPPRRVLLFLPRFLQFATTRHPSMADSLTILFCYL